MNNRNLVISILVWTIGYLKDFYRKLKEKVRIERVKKKVLDTSPVYCKDKNFIEILSVTSHDDYWKLILCVKSFFYFSKQTFPIFIVDDGTLTKQDSDLLKSHLIGCKILERKKIEMDLSRLKNKNFLLFKNNPYVVKKIASILYTKKDKVLFLDSDVLFFNYPDELIDWSNSQDSSIFIKDYQNAYLISDIESKYLFKVSQFSKVNSGLIGIKRNLLSLKLLNKLVNFYTLVQLFRTAQLQSYFAIIFALAKAGNKIKTFSKRYIVPEKVEDIMYEDVVCIHYVRPVRHEYIKGAEIVLKKIT
ncbi:hypothetical protein A2767_07680 [Candidatus Roizmanbacteria bacterium RIFCSPHIGHO2_01_FULL_35_10]|uniref:Nucleotide-diphospho-sugar transferase domain-containing protein n=1 Tax=Candidatus Roizmanbacteria bacterium RIFCSPLOWO2_01_FULL_35_13 TaxID=1802055 RepID=A0A1F7ICS2_9BACT|nr:MAG: hypothetical protein A2767_07680 [Candidatus Roizmanbacteria bacterium RIFCSPHIGHO2_01_FULL_35_10]OGK41146.1 MAG: hypothetical protein A3A74_02275 [Candidatus Roizmanbacteria bacterium RIFCSPLOWO2_01_FULL_35_13]